MIINRKISTNTGNLSQCRGWDVKVSPTNNPEADIIQAPTHRTCGYHKTNAKLQYRVHQRKREKKKKNEK